MTILNIYEFGKVNIVEIPQYNHSAGKIKNLTDHYYLVICFEADQRLLQHVGSFSFVGECVWVWGGVNRVSLCNPSFLGTHDPTVSAPHVL